MITIQSNNSFKSIRPFDPLNIQSDLVVISGLNGAGKTQLLHGINEGRISATVDGNALLPVKLYDVFRPAITESAKNVSINGNPPGLLEEIRKQFHNFLHFRDIALDSPEVAAMRQYTIASRIPRPSYEAVRLFNFVAKEVGKSPREISIEEIIRHMPPEPLNPPDLLSLPLANIYLTYFKRLEENEKEEFYYQKQG